MKLEDVIKGMLDAENKLCSPAEINLTQEMEQRVQIRNIKYTLTYVYNSHYMSTVSYKRNHHIFWVVECTFTIDGEVNRYLYKGVEQKYSKALEDAKKNHVWGNHPTFKTRVVGIRFE